MPRSAAWLASAPGALSSGLPPDRIARIGQILDEAAVLGAHIDQAMRHALSHLPSDDQDDAPA